jgi:hypothetical protein
MEYPYDSGGKHQDDKKFKENYDKIFSQNYDESGNCLECGMPRVQGHKMDCSKNWRNKPL